MLQYSNALTCDKEQAKSKSLPKFKSESKNTLTKVLSKYFKSPSILQGKDTRYTDAFQTVLYKAYLSSEVQNGEN